MSEIYRCFLQWASISVAESDTSSYHLFPVIFTFKLSRTDFTTTLNSVSWTLNTLESMIWASLEGLLKQAGS